MEFLCPAGYPRVATFRARVAPGNVPGHASSNAVDGVGGRDPGLFYFRERLTPGVLQLRGLACDCIVVGAWGSACRGIRRGVVTPGPACPSRALCASSA